MHGSWLTEEQKETLYNWWDKLHPEYKWYEILLGLLFPLTGCSPQEEEAPELESIPVPSSSALSSMEESSEEASTEKVSREQLTKILKSTGHFQANNVTDSMVSELNRVLQEYNITTEQEIQMFLAVTMHETRLTLTESGWLSEDTVRKYCERYEPNTSTGKDLGNTQVGDGYKFRGAGYIQLTGRYNYQ